jgi:hypothetical protein
MSMMIVIMDKLLYKTNGDGIDKYDIKVPTDAIFLHSPRVFKDIYCDCLTKNGCLGSRYYSNGGIAEAVPVTILKKSVDRCGRFHNDNGPAIVTTDGNGGTSEVYMYKGRIHRAGHPAITIAQDGLRIIEIYVKKGELYREGGLPTIIVYKDDVAVESATYNNGAFSTGVSPNLIINTSVDEAPATAYELTIQDGYLHNDNGPALTSGNTKEYYKDGRLHRVEGPARSSPDSLMWYCNGVLHNMSGPAVVANGRPLEYWIEGIRVPKVMLDIIKEHFRRQEAAVNTGGVA